MSLKTASNGSSPFVAPSDDPDTGIGRPSANRLDLIAGGSTVAYVNSSGMTLTGDLTVTGQLSQASGNFRTPQSYYLSAVSSSIAGSTTAGGFIALSNPFGADVMIQNVAFYLQTAASSAAATVNIGTNANSNSSADNIFDGLDLTTAGVFNPYDDGGTNGDAVRVWASDAFITGTVATGNVSDAVATVYITAIPL